MEGLAKVAMGLMRDVKKSMKERALSEEDFNNLTNQLKQEYNLNTDYLYHPKTNLRGLSYAIPDPKITKSLQKNPLKRALLGLRAYKGSADTLVNTVPLEEIVLHETGHIADPEQVARMKKAMNWGRLAALGHMGTAFGVPNLPDKVPTKAKAAIGAGLAGLTGVAAAKSHKYINQNEDMANQFVKSHWEKALGSAEAAEKKFAESLLPVARKTYGHHIGHGVGSALKAGMGLAGTLLSKLK